MKYYIDTNNRPYVFDDNITPEIIAKVETTHNTTLTRITLAAYKGLVAPTFTELQTAKISELKTSYEQANQLDIAYMGTTFQAGKESHDLIVAVLSAGTTPAEFYWVDSLNNQVAMTYTDLRGLSVEILERRQANFDKYQGLKAQVNAAASQTDLDLIAW